MTYRAQPRRIGEILSEHLDELRVRADSRADDEALLRERVAKRVRHRRLWSLGTTEEQLALDVDRTA